MIPKEVAFIILMIVFVMMDYIVMGMNIVVLILVAKVQHLLIVMIK